MSSENPTVLWALSPLRGSLHRQSSWHRLHRLGSEVLCVTGAEALYADMGHFGKRPIRLAWFGLVMPALVINYFGQGAMLLTTRRTWATRSTDGADLGAVPADRPGHLRHPVIASQALITAAFSVTQQAVQLGYLPARVRTPRSRETGQVYLPFINWALYVCIFAAVVFFGTSSKLAAAYGITVTIDMLITTTMTFFVIRYGWKYPWWVSAAATGFFFCVDFMFFAANIVKVARRRLVPPSSAA